MAVEETIELPNRALVVTGSGHVSVQSRPLKLPSLSGTPVVPDGHVLVRVKVTGICGSDIHAWKDKTGQSFVVGHECAGEILAIGKGVAQWKQKDRVAIMPALPCYKCEDCTMGAMNLCPNSQYFGVPGCDGSAMSLKVSPQEQLAALGPSMSWSEAGIVQPLAVCIHMSRQTGSFSHKKVIIFGAGCIGILMGRLAQLYGAESVVFVEKEQHRAQFVRDFLGCQAFVNPPRTSASESVDQYSQRFSDVVLENVSGLERGFDIAIEASGAKECMSMGIQLARPNGIFIQVGIYKGDHPQISMFEVLRKQLTIRGTLRYTTNCFEQAISLIERGLVQVKQIISHAYHFEDALDAFEAVERVEDKVGAKCLKVVILHDEKDMERFQHIARL